MAWQVPDQERTGAPAAGVDWWHRRDQPWRPMCGRFTQLRPWSDLVRLYQVTAPGAALNLPPRYNIAPTQDVPVVREREGEGRSLSMVRWGFIPFWAKDPAIAAKLINARAETLEEKPAFRHAFARQRCLVVADGFYEWQALGKTGKQPHYVTVAGNGPFAFAGLWETWRSPAGAAIDSCTIVTTAANPGLRPIHDRMPAILLEYQWPDWLETAAPAERLSALLKPFPGPLTIYPVGLRVNSVANDDAGCIAPLS